MTSEAEGGTSRAIGFDVVSKWFRTKSRTNQALSEVSLDVSAGEFVGIIGPSGCGKSTLLRLACGLETPDRGTISVAGERPDDARKRKRFAFVPQQPALLPWRTVGENVAILGQVNRSAGSIGLDAAGRFRLLEDVGLGPVVDDLPNELSGGMQQRVSIARAFALDAPIMLLDEPFSALDEITRAEMRYLLLDLWARAGSTAVFVTHSVPEAVALSDRIVVLSASPGRIITTIDVPLDRPRDESIEDSSDFHHLVSEVRAALKLGMATR